MARKRKQTKTQTKKETKTTCTQDSFFRQVLGDAYYIPTETRLHGNISVNLYVMATAGSPVLVRTANLFPADGGVPNRVLHDHTLPTTVDSELV